MLMSKILSSLPEHYKYFVSAWESTNKNEKTLSNFTSRLLTEKKECVKVTKNQQRSKYILGHQKGNVFVVANLGTWQVNVVKIIFHTDVTHAKRRITKKKIVSLEKIKSQTQLLIESIVTKDFVVISSSTSHMANDIQPRQRRRRNLKKTENCTLKKVLYFPELSKNFYPLIITQNDGVIKFTKNAVEANVKVLERNKEENGLYVIKLKQGNLEHAMVTTTSAYVWH